MIQQGFEDMIKRQWNEGKSRWPVDCYSQDGWHGNLCRIRQHLKGWNAQLIGQQKKAKSELLQELETIEKEANFITLSVEEWQHRYALGAKLEQIYQIEKIYWQQRVGDRWLVKGDSNTDFFHQYANGRRRKNTIISLENEQEKIRG